ncbi:MAG: TldD/PmbA family protein [Cyanobacteria bacterium J06641_5]
MTELARDRVLEQTLDLARPHTEAAEAYFLDAQSTPIEFENNRLKSLQAKATRGIALRVVCDGRLGFASATDLSRLEDLVAAAVQTAAIGDVAEFDFARDPLPEEPSSDWTPDSTDAIVAVGNGLIERVRAYNPDILVSAGFGQRSSQLRFATSHGSYGSRKRNLVSASLSGNLVRGEDLLEIFSSDVARDRLPDCDKLADDLLEKFHRAERNATIASGAYPVLFTPRAVASTLGRLFGTILSGQAVHQKSSPLADKLGETLFDPRLTLREEPNSGVSPCQFDDEGTLTAAKDLIEAGTVRNFYWDRRWAARAGQTSTGNGFRGGLSRPGPSLANFCMATGDTPIAEAIAKIETGIIVEQVLGAGQSNQLAGEFSVNLDLGYKIENGSIVGRVKNTAIAGNIFTAFKDQLVAIGNEAEWVGGRARLPYVLLDGLKVATKQ